MCHKKLDLINLLCIVTDVSRNEVVLGYLNRLSAYHHPTYVHSIHVAILSVQIGYEYGLSENQLFDLAYGAILHDIGKLNVPVSILNKKGKLNDEEFSLIQNHPVDSFHLVSDNFTFQKAVSKQIVEMICLMHHLKLNDTGYPSSFDERPDLFDYSRIPTECRIVTVCDIYDALVEIRPYKDSFTNQEAINELIRLGMNGAVDLHIVRILQSLILRNNLILQTTSLKTDTQRKNA